MTVAEWRVKVTDAAQADFDDILAWTAERFGVVQAGIYADLIESGLATLAHGPTTRTIRRRRVGEREVFTLQPCIGHRRAKHILVLQVAERERMFTLLRILHVKMDLTRHLIPD